MRDERRLTGKLLERLRMMNVMPFQNPYMREWSRLKFYHIIVVPIWNANEGQLQAISLPMLLTLDGIGGSVDISSELF